MNTRSDSLKKKLKKYYKNIFKLIKSIINSIQLLNNIQKKKYFTLTLFFFIGSLIELSSIFLLFQFIQVLTGSININDISFLNYLNLESINFSKSNSLILIILLLFFLKFIFFISIYFFQFRFIQNLNYFFSSRLLNIYLYQNMNFHLNSKTNLLTRNITSEISQFTVGVLQQISLLTIEVLTILSISLFLIYNNPEVFLISLGFIALISLTYFYFAKSIFLKNGKIRQKFSGEIIKEVLNSLNGIKELKIFKAENFFLKKYDNSMHQLVKANVKINTMSQIPRLGLEFILVILLSIAFTVFFSMESITPSLLSTIGLFALASFKLIPSATKILNCLQSIKFNYPTIHLLKKELSLGMKEKNENDNIKKIEFKTLKFENVSFSYDLSKKNIFSNFNLKIQKGDCIGIVGPSGVGKSTLVNLIIGLFKPIEGKISFNDNINFTAKNIKIGYVPQNIFLMNDTIANNIAFGLNNDEINFESLENSLNLSRMSSVVNALDNKYYTVVGEKGTKLSGGQIQRLGISRALYKNSDLLIFDEATSSLDENTEKEIINTIKSLSKNKTVIFITHKKKLLNFCNKIINLEDI